MAVMAESSFIKAGAPSGTFSKATGSFARLRMCAQKVGIDRLPDFNLLTEIDRLTKIKPQFVVTAKIDLFSNGCGSPALSCN
jgi:hypothetical protein